LIEVEVFLWSASSSVLLVGFSQPRKHSGQAAVTPIRPAAAGLFDVAAATDQVEEELTFITTLFA
jgi:hypothetical protein